MMKTKLFSAVLATVALLPVASCSSSDDQETIDKPLYITVDTQIGNATAARTSTLSDGSEVFSEGDVISVYAWTGESTKIPTDLVVNDSRNTLTSGSWVSKPQMLWLNTTASHYFLGVYPARKITNFTADAFSLSTDDIANDLLIAVNTSGLTATQNPVSLVFNHVMAKLVVNLSFRNQWGENSPTVTSIVANALNSATVNYLASAPVTATGTAADIPLSAATANAKYTSVMVPQASFRTIVITIDGKQYTYDATQDIPLEQGKVTTVNLIVGRNIITAENVRINNWVDGETINGGEAL